MRSAPEAPPIEALVVDREALIRMMRIVLEEMHNRRVTTPHFNGDGDLMQLLRYWETVFGWIKEQGHEDFVLMTRRRTLGPD